MCCKQNVDVGLRFGLAVFAGSSRVFLLDAGAIGRAWTAPVAEGGLTGPYSQVAMDNVPGRRGGAAVAQCQGQVWLVGGLDKRKSHETWPTFTSPYFVYSVHSLI